RAFLARVCQGYGDLRTRHSVPTRRSSDLIGGIRGCADELLAEEQDADRRETLSVITRAAARAAGIVQQLQRFAQKPSSQRTELEDRKSTRLNSSHVKISYAVFCLKKKT